MTHPPQSTQPKAAQRRSALRLLLSRGDSERPEAVLPQGLSPQLLDGAPAPHVPSIPAGRQAFGDQTRDASLLAERRWGLVLPAAEPLRGQLLSAMEPLIRVRAAQQGIDSATLLRELSYIAPADPYLPLPRAVDWYRHTIAESDADDSQRRSELERPDYLLVLGDLHQVSENITSVLCSYGHFVGRLAFSDEAGQPRLAEYRQYAEKAAAAADRDGPTPDDEEDDDERGEPSRVAEGLKPRRARLHYVSDGSDATELAYELLLSPLISRLGQAGKKGSAQDLNPMQAAALYNSDDLLNSARTLSSSVLFTVSHGYGGPRGGYGSPAEQRRQQGALTFASTAPGRGRRLSGDDLRALRTPFLPGGVWFMLACYGAGTPAESQFYHWLASRRDRLDDEARWVLRSLPAPAQRQPDSHPFIAALPQAALAQPDGPLALIGHLDLAWSYSFVDSPDSGEAERERGDYDHFETLVRSLLRGARVGSALTTLLRKRRSAEQSLLRRYDAQRRAQFQPSDGGSEAATDPERSPPVDMALRRHWMTRQDLMGYVLLGDPAARLWRHGSPVGTSKLPAQTLSLRPEPAPQVDAPAPQVDAPAAPAVDPQLTSKLRRLEDALCELTLGTGSPAALALALGLSEGELLALQAAYQRAGRAALKP